MVESNSNRSRSPSVFKTVPGPAQITLHKLWYPCPDSNRELVTPFERAAFTYLATGALLIGASGGSRTHIGQLSVAHGI